MNGFEKFKEELPSKEKFYSLITDENFVKRNMKIILMFGEKLE